MSAATTHDLPAPKRTGEALVGGLVLASALILASGAALALVVVMRLASGDVPLSYALWVALSGAIAAWAGLAVSWRDFGWPGARGFLRAMRGGIIFSFAAALAGGSMILPVFGTMFAPFAVLVTLIAKPAAAVGLIATLTTANRALGRWRAQA